MDMALEMGSSIANLGGAGGGNSAVSSFRPDGSFCVVPPGSSYASSSSMWTSGIVLGGGGGALQQQQQQQQLRQISAAKQQGSAGVRSRANRLQNFLGGGGITNNVTMMQMPNTSPQSLQTEPTSTSIPPSQQQQPQDTQVSFPMDNVPLDQSWWGGGQGSLMASSTILSATAKAATASAAQQSHLPTSQHASGTLNQDASDGDSRANARQTSSTTNARQLMQLMDSLNRLGNENAQLMREVEGAKVSNHYVMRLFSMYLLFDFLTRIVSQRLHVLKQKLQRI